MTPPLADLDYLYDALSEDGGAARQARRDRASAPTPPSPEPPRLRFAGQDDDDEDTEDRR